MTALNNSASFSSKFPQNDSLKQISQTINKIQKNQRLGLHHASSEFKLNDLAGIKTSSKAKMNHKIGSIPKTQLLGNYKGLQ